MIYFYFYSTHIIENLPYARHYPKAVKEKKKKKNLSICILRSSGIRQTMNIDTNETGTEDRVCQWYIE